VLLADHRVDSVAANRDCSVHGGTIAKPQRDFGSILLEPEAVPAEVNALRADPRLHRVEQERLQVAAMDRELRPRVAGLAPQRFLIYELAEPVEEHALGGLDRDARERRLEAELAEDLGSVRQQVDADADRLDLGRRLEDAARNAAPMQL